MEQQPTTANAGPVHRDEWPRGRYVVGPDGSDHSIGAVRHAVGAVLGTEIPPSVTLIVRRGSAAATLIDQSKDADLLVVGSRGHGGFVGLHLRSVSAACAEHAKCPVLVVHGTRANRPDPIERAALDL